MAKESMKAREVKRVKLANRYAHKREEIAAKVKSGEMDHEEAWIALSIAFSAGGRPKPFR